MSVAPAHFHAVVWMDHREARVFHFNADDVARTVIHPDRPNHHLHHKSGSIGAGHAGEDHHYFDSIAAALAKAGEVLVLGPGQAKQAFVSHVRAKKGVGDKIVGVETVDHPSDGQIVAHAKRYFKVADRMTPQKP